MLVANQQLIELGKLRHGIPYRFSYTLKNEGPTKVTITKLHAGCSSCTKASIVGNVIDPGANSTVDVVFTPNSNGQQRRRITVNYNDNQSIVLEFIADVY